MALGAGVAAVSAVALLAWHAWLRPDLTDLVRTFVPPWPVWLLVPGAMLFALANAALEEAAYRGVVLDALDTALGHGVVSIVLQAIAFAALHFQMASRVVSSASGSRSLRTGAWRTAPEGGWPARGLGDTRPHRHRDRERHPHAGTWRLRVNLSGAHAVVTGASSGMRANRWSTS